MIDNCLGDALLLRLAFRHAKFELEFDVSVSAGAGLAALEYKAEQAAMPDLVLCDLHLPRMSGIDLLGHWPNRS